MRLQCRKIEQNVVVNLPELYSSTVYTIYFTEFSRVDDPTVVEITVSV